MIKDDFTVKEAAQVSKLSPYMVDYLCKQKLITPKKIHNKRGKARIFPFREIILLRVYKLLLDKGVSVSRLVKTKRTWYKKYKKILNSNSSFPPKMNLITNGVDIFFQTNEEVIENLTLNGQLEFNFMISLNNINDFCREETSKLEAA